MNDCEVFVDELGVFGDPYFEDGPLAKQAAAAVAQGVVYVTAGGNDAVGHYEADYVGVASGEVERHDFGAASGSASDTDMNVTIRRGGFLIAFLQWNDPFSASGNDYDLKLMDDFGFVLDASTSWQDGDDKPFEVVMFDNQGAAPTTVKLLVEKASGADRRLEMFLLGRGMLIDE